MRLLGDVWSVEWQELQETEFHAWQTDIVQLDSQVQCVTKVRLSEGSLRKQNEEEEEQLKTLSMENDT